MPVILAYKRELFTLEILFTGPGGSDVPQPVRERAFGTQGAPHQSNLTAENGGYRRRAIRHFCVRIDTENRSN